MKILALRMMNVKSYEDITIRFQAGVNFISGINGAGKTTIIESIGFVLFDYLAYPVKQFVREGKKSGEIQLLFEACDERMYRVIRKFNHNSKTTKWEVYDEASQAMLDQLHGSKDVVNWIKESIGVEKEDNLVKMYQQIISVQQGLFTAPFFETPEGRKRIFEGILKVEGYRDAFEKTKSLSGHFDVAIAKLQSDSEHLRTELEVLPEIEAKLADAQKQRKIKEEELVRVGQVLKSQGQMVTDLGNIKEEISQLEAGVQLRLTQLQSVQERLQAALQDELGAEQAKILVSQSEVGHGQYIESQKQLQKTEKQLKQLQELSRTVEQAEQSWAVASAQLQAEQNSVVQQKQELDDALADLLEEQRQVESRLGQAEQASRQAQEWFTTSESWKQPIQRIIEWFEQNQEDVEQANQQLEVVKGYYGQIQDLVELTKGQDGYQKELETLQSELQLEGVIAKKASFQGQKEALLKNRHHLETGICPIIQERCPSTKVSGDLQQFFKQQLHEFEHEISLLITIEKSERARKSQIDKVQSKLDRLKADQLAMANLKEKSEVQLQGIGQILSSLDQRSLDGYVVAATTNHKQIVEAIAGCNLWIQDQPLEIAPYFVTTGLEPSWSHIQVMHNSVTDFDQWFARYKSQKQRLALWVKEQQFTLRAIEEWLQSLVSQTNQRVRLIEKEREQIEKLREKNEREQVASSQKQERITEQSIHLAQQKLSIQEKRKDLGDLLAVEHTIEQLKQSLIINQPLYDQYKENYSTAQKLAVIVRQIKTDRENREKIQGEWTTMEARLAELKAQYDADLHQKLQEQVQNSQLQVQALQIEVRQIDKELADYEGQCRSLSEKQVLWEQKLRALKRQEQKKELSQLIRSVLKDAADPIAQEYRSYLSSLATRIYTQVSNENVQVEWADKYELQLLDNYRGNQRSRVFKQLSGGEQMTVALAVRLALMQTLSNVGIGFFDEPTANLDEERRHCLGLAISKSTGAFSQLFVISHDDAFDTVTENAITLQKDIGNGTQVCKM